MTKILKTAANDNQAPKTRKVRNLMSGNMIDIAANTPFCCDPSTETYWSM